MEGGPAWQSRSGLHGGNVCRWPQPLGKTRFSGRSLPDVPAGRGEGTTGQRAGRCHVSVASLLKAALQTLRPEHSVFHIQCERLAQALFTPSFLCRVFSYCDFSLVFLIGPDLSHAVSSPGAAVCLRALKNPGKSPAISQCRKNLLVFQCVPHLYFVACG